MGIANEKIEYTDGSVYIGTIKNGKRHGKGIFVFPDSTKYDGEWNNDERCGYGTLTYPDGSKYEGEWSGNDFHGIYTSLDGKHYKQYWINGEKISEESIMKTQKNETASMFSNEENVSTSIDNEILPVLKEIAKKFGSNCFKKGGSANNLLADYLPGTNYAKRRRRIKAAVDSGACEILLKMEYEREYKINYAKTLLIEYSDMAEDIATEIINTLAQALL